MAAVCVQNALCQHAGSMHSGGDFNPARQQAGVKAAPPMTRHDPSAGAKDGGVNHKSLCTTAFMHHVRHRAQAEPA
jgi:hypothetical protein